MDITIIENHYHIKVEPAAPVVRYLISQVHAYEHQYNMSSSKMVYSLRLNKVKETEDICSWMHDYRTLKKLRNGKNGI
jgi:hypothetical protein